MWLANVNDDMKRLLSLTKLNTFLPLLDEFEDDGDAARPAARLPRAPGPLSSSSEADLPPPGDFA